MRLADTQALVLIRERAKIEGGLIISAMRQIPLQMASLKSGNWQKGVGKTLRGHTLGIFCYGRVGRAVADVGKAFGMNVVIWASEGYSSARRTPRYGGG